MRTVAQRLAALFVIGVALFFSPLLLAFSQPEPLWGLPRLPVYLFLVWAALIVATVIVSRGEE